MDKEAERKQQLTAEEVAIQTYLDHPITQKIFADNAEQQESLIDLILNRPVINVETFLRVNRHWGIFVDCVALSLLS